MSRTTWRRALAALMTAPAAVLAVLTVPLAPVQAAAGEPSAEMAVTVDDVPIRDSSTVADGGDVSVGVSGLLTPGTGTRELRATLDPGMVYTAGSAQAPEGWTIQFSTDNGGTWGGSEPNPASGVTDVRATASVTAGAITGYSQLYASSTVAPVPSSTFAGSTGGDGWDVFFSDDYVFNIFHHNPSAIVLDCHLRSTGARCAGYTATFNGYQTANRSGGWVDSITGKLYAFTTQSSTARPGVLCIDVASTPTSCGFTPLSTDTTVNSYGYLTNAEFVGRRIFGVETSGTGSLLCFDAALGAQCPGSPIDLAGATDSNQTYPLSLGDEIVVKTATQMYCFDAATLAPCAGTWPAAISAANATPAAPHTDDDGDLDGVCWQGGCLDRTGAATAWTSPWTLGASAWPITGGYFSGAVTQGRYYFVSADPLKLDCFDYSTDARCANFPTTAFPNNFNGIYASRVDPNNPSCIWINSDGGQIRNLDAFTGQLGCNDNPVITLQPSSFAPRFTCTNPNSIDEWRVLTLASVSGGGTPAATTLTVRDALGQTVPGWVNKPVTIGQTLDMTGLDVALSTGRPTFSFGFSGITGGSITQATIDLEYAGKGPELCLDATLDASLIDGTPNCPVLTGLDGALIDSVPSPAQTFPVRREFTIGNDSSCPEDIQPMTVPSVPRDLSGTGSLTTGLLNFRPPADDGGSALREYKLSLDGGTTWTTPTVVDHGDGTYDIALAGLTGGTTYPVELKATNVIGRSLSATLALVVSSQPPAPPAPPATPEIRVEVPAGGGKSAGEQPVDLGIADLRPGTGVTVTLGDLVVGEGTTDGNGDVDVDVTLPTNLAPGTHVLKVRGTGPDGEPFERTESLFVDWSGAIAPAPPTAGGYTPITPRRVLDTREAPGTAVPARTEHRVVLPQGLLPSDVTGISFNLTVAEPARSGYLTAHVCGSAIPSAASLNYAAGETTANLVESSIRAGQDLCVFTMSEAHVVVDVTGFHSESSTQLLEARAPVRLVDTRLTTALAADSTMVVPVIGDGRAPAGTSSAYLDIAVTSPEGAGFITVFPCGEERPWASTLNFVGGELASNSAIAKIGTDGAVCVYTTTATDLVVDLTATFSSSGTGRFSGYVPGRLSDTRLDTKIDAFQTIELTVVGDGANPAGTQAVALNIGVDAPERAGFLTVWPCAEPRPWTSALDYQAGESVSNHVTAEPDAAGKVCVYSMSPTHVIVDIEGIYWAPTT
ncbi:MAG: fibronectin type III domain-containing protein [Acidimicrobiales bacterium]|nr:fibronectin type III domain-containing protein [Acidimicrobiales bacterium]